jgi:hypothetical protein
MNDFYYSQKDGLAFWVSGYAKDSGSVQEIINWHPEKSNKFAAMAGVPLEAVQTGFIGSSPRFKYIQVYSAKEDQCPPGAFECGSDRQMWQVLTQ